MVPGAPGRVGTGAVSAPAGFDALLLLIGRLNYTWTNTESLLIHLMAGLMGTDKDTAVVVFLTLNTSRARVDLVERLAKMERRDAGERDEILALTRQLLKLSGLRNRYNHCLYGFDPERGTLRTIQMRIADRKSDIRMGRAVDVDAGAMEDIRQAIADLAALNERFWATIRHRAYPV